MRKGFFSIGSFKQVVDHLKKGHKKARRNLICNGLKLNFYYGSS